VRNAAGTLAYPHANFYRVVAVNEGTTPETVEFELQQPLRGFNIDDASFLRTFVTMEGVVEVFDKGPGRSLDQ
jgi:hypothetical protein